MNSVIAFDTRILIDQLRANSWLGPLFSVRGTVRNSSVVLDGPWCGAIDRTDREVLLKLEKNHTVLTPSAKNWIESGQICAKLCSDLGFNPAKLRDLYFNVLIALTVRSQGAKLITSNRNDFELIRIYRDFELEVW